MPFTKPRDYDLRPSRRPQYPGTWIKESFESRQPQQRDLLPIRITIPAQAHVGLWGGEGILQGWRLARGLKMTRRYKKEFRPLVETHQFYPELINQGNYLKIQVTPRTCGKF